VLRIDMTIWVRHGEMAFMEFPIPDGNQDWYGEIYTCE
jgi:hypothetical protein